MTAQAEEDAQAGVPNEPEPPGCVGPFFALFEQRTGELILSVDQEIAAHTMSPFLTDTRPRTGP